jgi:hypothetical protein
MCAMILHNGVENELFYVLLMISMYLHMGTGHKVYVPL